MLNLVPLQSTGTALRAGLTLPWSVHDDSGVLLLARGAVIEDEAELRLLKDRAVFASYAQSDDEECAPRRSRGPESVFDQMYLLGLKLSSTLRLGDSDALVENLRVISQALLDMAEDRPDPLIFSVIKPDETRLRTYGVTHSIDVAAVCAMLAIKLEMPPERRDSLLLAALTMNISVTGLQTTLAKFGGRLSAEQQLEIDAHPLKSVEMLREIGVKDALWLEAVEQHHEIPGGFGYPKRMLEPGALSQMLRLVDVFLAKHAPRGSRIPLPSKQAAQELYRSNQHLEEAALLIKEIGIYPPGSHVKLVNGEIGIVVKRGKTSLTPIVTVLLNNAGMPAARKVRRDTSMSIYAVERSVPARDVKYLIPATKLYERKEL